MKATKLCIFIAAKLSACRNFLIITAPGLVARMHALANKWECIVEVEKTILWPTPTFCAPMLSSSPLRVWPAQTLLRHLFHSLRKILLSLNWGSGLLCLYQCWLLAGLLRRSLHSVHRHRAVALCVFLSVDSAAFFAQVRALPCCALPFQ